MPPCTGIKSLDAMIEIATTFRFICKMQLKIPHAMKYWSIAMRSSVRTLPSAYIKNRTCRWVVLKTCFTQVGPWTLIIFSSFWNLYIYFFKSEISLTWTIIGIEGLCVVNSYSCSSLAPETAGFTFKSELFPHNNADMSQFDRKCYSWTIYTRRRKPQHIWHQFFS